MDITTPPLGTFDAFSEFASPRSWGPDNAWRATFGSGVVADLASGLRDHPAAVRARFPATKAEAHSVVLGCVPWLDSERVVDALLAVGNFCVVVDKSARGSQLARLSREGIGVWQMLVRGLEYWGPPEDGRPQLIGPGTPPFGDERGLEPVRVVGWRKKPGTMRVPPLLHAKLAVCCAAYTWDNDMGSSEDHLLPMNVWMGSANWTERSPWHLEFGAWSNDPALAQAALEYITAVIKISEPLGSPAERPSPEMVEGEEDHAAFYEYLSEHPSEPDDPDD